MRINLKFFYFITLISTFFCISCHSTSERISADFYDFDQNGMKAGQEYIFHPFEGNRSDSLSTFYNIFICIRYTNKCELKKLPVEIEYYSLSSDSIIEIKTNIPLYDNEDHFLGKGNFGVFETEVPILKKISYQEEFTIEITTQEENTQGLLSLGVICKK